MQETNSEVVGFRLSPQQERRLEANPVQAAVQCVVAFARQVSEESLREALETQIARHEILRTTFPRQSGIRRRTQVIQDSGALEWTHLTAPSDLGGEALAEVIAGETQRPFDLDGGPLVRGLLASGDPDRSLLVLTVHGACADLVSLLSLVQDLTASPAGPSEPQEPIQYADYAEWRYELIHGDDEPAAEGRAFWAAYAPDALPATPRLLFARPGPGSEPHRRVTVRFSPQESASILQAARNEGATVADFFEASWHCVIGRLSATSELLVAGWCAGRAQADLEHAVGAYSQPLPIRSRVEQPTTFVEVLDQIRRGRAEAERWQDFAAAEDLRGVDRASAAAFLSVDISAIRQRDHAVSALNPAPAAALLLLLLDAGAQDVAVEIWHDGAVYDERDADDLAQGLRTLALQAAADPTRAVVQMTLTEPAERERLVAESAGPAPAAEARTPVHVLFERRVDEAPGAPAVADSERELSYEELNRSANRLAHLLRASGVTRGTRVAVCTERTVSVLEAIMGTFKAGGAYVALNSEHPVARLSHQLTESEAKVLVTQEHLLDRFADFAGEVVCVDRDRERIETFSDENAETRCGPEDLAYVMYTSGSTGLPKGVAVTHGNLANYATDIAQRLRAAGDPAEMRFGVVSAISTDLGNTCIYPALVAGGCVALISPGAATDATAVQAELRGRGLDVLKITPSHLQGLLEGGDAGVLPRRWLIVGGEALSWDLVRRVRTLAPECRILNHYGPTETTIGCCAYDVEEVRSDCQTVPIGRPLAGTRAYVLDRALQPLPAGVPGELCIAGNGVAAGYLGSNASGDGSFLSDPHHSGRMYRTGDRARYLRDGAIEFLGRIDDQVKIRGFRIEPGEIEAALSRHPVIRQAAVVPEPDDRGELHLVAYIATSADPSVEELQTFLQQSLPEYMVPATFASLPSLPFTPSGKIDRRALVDLTAVQTRRQAEYVAPRDPVEKEIAEIWAALLGVDEVGVLDDFFSLGGHSLMATQAIMRIRRVYGDIPLRVLLAAPTVAALADVVRASGAAAERSS